MRQSPKTRLRDPSLIAALAGLGLLALSCSSRISPDPILAAYRDDGAYPEFTLRYPLDGTVFPPEIVAPTFSWQDSPADAWVIRFQFPDSPTPLGFLSLEKHWTPEPKAWDDIKRRSREKAAKATVLGFQRGSPAKILSRGRITLSTSPDEVGAPLFYREVNLPFFTAVKDPSLIRWRFGVISSPDPPPVVLEHLPVCGNCHSFSRDGSILGMDVDYANNKGAYAITRVDKQMTLAVSDIIAWDDFRKEDRQQTFGLLSQVSPDGQTVVSTVKDKSVFVPTPGLAFSQLFFPIKGILVVYHRNSGTFQALPGADDPEYVQSNPSWSPDGKYIVFARAKAYELKSKDAGGKLLLSEEDCAEFLKEGKLFPFDLYRIPYNDGRGGKPEPLAGASRNGRSNYFAKYSPDGKWIVFCQARSFMLLQPDSELFIIPAAGGEARRLRCNTSRMNSWHSWSPNGRWLVFSSKIYSDYTQLFLTHMDDQGESTPPVLLDHFNATNRAANIPEFVNVKPGAIEKIREQFLDDLSHTRAAYAAENSGDTPHAIAEYQKALETNPKNVHAHQRLGFLLYNNLRQFEAGLAHTTEALRLDPNDACAHYDLGMALMHQGQMDVALPHLSQAVRLMPEGFDRRYNAADMHYALASAWIAKGDFKEAATALIKAAQADPKKAEIQYTLALTLAAQGLIDEPLKAYTLARSLRPDLDTAPQLHDLMSLNYAKAGLYQEALEFAQKGLALAQAGGQTDLASELRERLESYRQKIAKREP